MNRTINIKVFVLTVLIAGVLQIAAAPVVRLGTGANAAALQAIVDQFRNDLGGSNNGVGGSFISGRREINWDGVPDSFSEPNNLPPDFFNVNSPRGVIFNSIEDVTGAGLNQFAVSATTASGTAVRFGNINATYAANFQTFSAERLFIARNTHLLEITFVIPGTNIPATVKGFGVIFSDVDGTAASTRSLMRLYDANGRQLPGGASATALDNGLSFVGVSYNAGERVARVVIECGNGALSASNTDGVNGFDAVAMDDFIYGEPRATQFHHGDYDGDGFKDASIFRPSVGQFFVLNSGSNTLTVTPFGTNGDIPVDGDFDGDSRTDFAVYRPTTGEWWVQRSSNGTNFARQFGTPTDKPVVGDYDKDGKTDLAFWRPSTGQYFIVRSSDGFTSFFTQNWGTNGDIPIGVAAQ